MDMDGHHHHDHSNHQHGSGSTTTTTASSVEMSSKLNSTIENSEMEYNSDHGHANHADHNMIMRMYFHGGVQETILFEFWRISESGGLIMSMIGIFFLAFAYEAIKFYREHLYRHSFQTVHYNTVTVPTENGTTMKETHKTVQSSLSNTTCFNSHSNPPGITPIFISQTTCNCPVPRNQIEGKCNDFSNNNVSSAACGSCPSTPIRIPVLHRAYKVRMFSWMHAWQTFLHMVQVVLSYFLMLIFMTYNVWLCLAVALGAGAGYFFVGWKKSLVVDITEHCH